MGAICLGLGARSPGTLLGSLLGLWDCLGRSQERKNADRPMRKPFFSKIAFFASWSPRWLSWALLAPPVLVLTAPKMFPKVAPRWFPKLAKKRTSHLIVFGFIFGEFWDPKRGGRRDPFFKVFRLAWDGHRHQLHHHLDSILGPNVFVFHGQNTCHAQKYLFCMGKMEHRARKRIAE